jgi:uncharacterized membrane protein YeaQ/YmgE (transglycosylase-associated protein family)
VVAATRLTMARRWLTNLLLGLVAAVLGWLVLEDIQYGVGSGRLTELTPDAVHQIELKRDAGPLIRLERRDGDWWMLAPTEAPADADAVDRLLGIVGARVGRILPADAAALGRLGLEPPRIRLRLNGLTLQIGDTDPVSAGRYVMIGDLVQLIRDDQLPWLLAGPERYLSRRLLPKGFSPGIGSIDGRPLSADALAALVDVFAAEVDAMQDELSGRIVLIRSADGDDVLRFLVADAGTRWTRLDQRLSYRFAAPPLAEGDEDDAAALPALHPPNGDAALDPAALPRAQKTEPE